MEVIVYPVMAIIAGLLGMWAFNLAYGVVRGEDRYKLRWLFAWCYGILTGLSLFAWSCNYSVANAKSIGVWLGSVALALIAGLVFRRLNIVRALLFTVVTVMLDALLLLAVMGFVTSWAEVSRRLDYGLWLAGTGMGAFCVMAAAGIAFVFALNRVGQARLARFWPALCTMLFAGFLDVSAITVLIDAVPIKLHLLPGVSALYEVACGLACSILVLVAMTAVFSARIKSFTDQQIVSAAWMAGFVMLLLCLPIYGLMIYLL